MTRSYRQKTKIAVAAEVKARPEDVSFLTEEEIALLEDEADQEVQQELKDKEIERVKASIRSRKRREASLEGEMVTVLIDVPGHSDRITVDGSVYFHGHSYVVPYGLSQMIHEIMFRAWQHEWNVGGANSNDYRRPTNTQLNMANLHQVPTINLSRQF